MNRFDLIKSLAPGFLPLIVFIVADSIWGTTVGLAVGVISGIIELLISYIRERSIDRFILIDTFLIVVLGGVSLILENDIFFKLKPALIESIFCLILGLSAFTPFNILQMLSRRYLKNLPISESQLAEMTRGFSTLFFIFLGHTLLIVYSAFFLSRWWWGFISGGLFYILFAVYFGAEVLRKRWHNKELLKKYAGEEWLDIVDSEGRIKGRLPRSLCHDGPGQLHPVVHLHVFDSTDRIFLQKRSASKDIQPGKWDTAVGGHVLAGESIDQALKREAREELGLVGFSARLVTRYVWESERESELVFMFLTRMGTGLKVNFQEMDEGRFWKVKKIKEDLGQGTFTPNFELEFGILLKQVFGSG